MNLRHVLPLPLLTACLFACTRDAPPEPIQSETPTNAPAAVANAGSDIKAVATTTPPPAAAAKPSGGDPLNGSFSLADATKDIKGTGALTAKIDTSKGAVTCKLFEDKAPNTVANFVGLARGTRPWKDPATGTWVTRPAYNGTVFHRIIKGFMIQGGDPKGNGSGEPGYVIKDELWEGAKHDRAGLLCMANRGHDTNGAQFFITDAAAAHLDHNYTIFGECAPVDVVHTIASVPLNGERPETPVNIKSVTVARENPAK